MSEIMRVGFFAAACIVIVAGLIASFGGPVWYAVGPAFVFAAYAVKLKVRKLRDEPRIVVMVLAVVSLAMLGFAWFNRTAG